jgi:hypothetical protein
MAASAAALKYEVLHKKSIGDVFLCVTKIEISGEAEEYKKGGVVLNYGETGFGLPLATPDVAFAIGPFTDSKYEKSYDTLITPAGNLVLFAQGAEKKSGAELTEAEGKALAKYTAIIVTIGK